MEAIKNGLRKNLSPAQLWSGARFFLLLNLGLIIYAVALNFYCAPNHFVFGGTTGLSVVLATCFPALSVSTFMWITNAVLDVLGCVFLGIKAMGWTLYSSFMLSFYSSMCEKLFPMSQPLTDDTLLELCFAVALPALASGIVFNIGASTGGTEIVAMILHKYIKVEIGRALLLSDIGGAVCGLPLRPADRDVLRAGTHRAQHHRGYRHREPEPPQGVYGHHLKAGAHPAFRYGNTGTHSDPAGRHRRVHRRAPHHDHGGADPAAGRAAAGFPAPGGSGGFFDHR